jgi:hypothetical protein
MCYFHFSHFSNLTKLAKESPPRVWLTALISTCTHYREHSGTLSAYNGRLHQSYYRIITSKNGHSTEL